MTTTNSPPPSENNSQRNKRFTSHALVEVRAYRFLPFLLQSAVLLDISLQGFKIEFTSEFIATVGNKYWLSIPLAPLGIYAPTKLNCQTQCRWFDEQRHRIGGVFLELDKTQRLIIDQIITTLKEKEFLYGE